MILRVVAAEASGPHSLTLTFSDGTTKRVDVLPILEGPVFVPLRDPHLFARVAVDPLAGTVVWPNGVDLAPEALHQLPDEGDASPRRQASARKG